MSKEVMRQALEALEMSHELANTGYTDFKKYGLVTDKDILEKLFAVITALREALAEQPAYRAVKTYHEGKPVYVAEQPAQQVPVVWKWQQAPIRTAWGDDMVVASVAIDKDHTVGLYCEREQTAKVEAMFAQRKPLTVDQIRGIYEDCDAPTSGLFTIAFARAIEAAHGIKENT